MLIKYIKEGIENSARIGCIAMEGDKFGISICNKKDRFNKHLARKIAIERLQIGKNPAIPNRKILDREYNLIKLEDYVYDALSYMKEKQCRIENTQTEKLQ